MIDCLIFSKDRACQLDLLLRSIKDNFKELTNIKILYLATNDQFRKGFDLIQNIYPEFEWVPENDFVHDTMNIFYSFTSEFVLNFVDDEIVIRNTPIEPALKFLRLNETHCVSLRLAPYINYCYTANTSDPPPELTEMDIDGTKMYRWNWRHRPNIGSNWGYPSCINSHIYNRERFVHYISLIHYKHPNGLEGMFNNIRENFKPINACFGNSKSVNIANNIIQTGTNRHGMKSDFSVETLNTEFLHGRRLSTKPFYNIQNTLATFEKDYQWE